MAEEEIGPEKLKNENNEKTKLLKKEMFGMVEVLI